MVSRLVEALAALPDTALVPVGWIRALADTEPAVPADAPELSVAVFGRLVSRSAAQVRQWCAAGAIPGAYRLPGNKRPGAWRIPVASVVAFRSARAEQRDIGRDTTTPPEPRSAPAPAISDWRDVRRSVRRRRRAAR